jgi:hypothetical protein
VQSKTLQITDIFSNNTLAGSEGFEPPIMGPEPIALPLGQLPLKWRDANREIVPDNAMLFHMSRKDLRQFDYTGLAKLDTEMWRAYYEHRFARLFSLLLQLMRKQFGFGLFLSLRGAYYAALAASDYRITIYREHFPRVEKRLVKLYKLMSENATEPFDYRKAAAIELEWWNIHRYPAKYKKPLHVGLAEGAAAIYNGRPKDFAEYGRLRAEAMHIRDTMDKKADWPKIESLLTDSWQALHRAVFVRSGRRRTSQKVLGA